MSAQPVLVSSQVTLIIHPGDHRKSWNVHFPFSSSGKSWKTVFPRGGGGGGILEGFEWKQNILIKDIKHFEFFVLGSTKVFGNIYFMICAENVFS